MLVVRRDGPSVAGSFSTARQTASICRLFSVCAAALSCDGRKSYVCVNSLLKSAQVSAASNAKIICAMVTLN